MMDINGVEIWGPTLFDLFTVRRIPNVHQLVTYTSGTKLAGCMKYLEENYAKDLITRQKWVFPENIDPYDIGILIKEDEMLVNNSGVLLEKSWNKDDPRNRFKLPRAVGSNFL